MTKEPIEAVTEEVDVTQELSVIQAALDRVSLTGPERRQVDAAFSGVLKGVQSPNGTFKAQQ